jgi:phospholipid transport system substrate-binding protein
MTLFKKIASLMLVLGMAGFMSVAAAQEAPDALVKRISQDVLDSVKADKTIQSGNQKKIFDLVDSKILPYVDFQRMTQMAAGRYWRDATPEQQKQLTDQFRTLLIYTYSGAIAQIRDQQLQFQPFRMDPGATDGVEVKSQVLQPRGEPVQLNYRLEKVDNGWKIYDVNVLGAWLIESYKSSFANEINKGGMDGLIKTLTDKNQRLAAAKSK